MIQFQRVGWQHDLDGEPTSIYSEVSGGEETRKVELFADGRLEYAGPNESTGTTFLSVVPMPSPGEIEQAGPFTYFRISSLEFEEIWHRARSAHEL